MKNKQRNSLNGKLTALLSLLMAMILVAGSGILAYLIDADRAKNEITIGSNTIQIEEEFTPPAEVKPGVTFTKNVKVKNTGPTDCYVRIKAVFTTSDMEKFCEVDWNTTDWIYSPADNYWYYPRYICEGEKTPSLFTKVSVKERYDFDGDGTEEDGEIIPEAVIQDFDIIVYAESYQAGEFRDYENAYLDAWSHYQANKPD